jgi:hypothetical protein
MSAPMNIQFSHLVTVTLTLLVACERVPEAVTQPPSGAQAVPARPSTNQPALSAPGSLLTVRLLGPAQAAAGQDIGVTAEVEQHVGANAVQLELRLPMGARLVSGKQMELLPLGDDTLQRHFVVHLDSLPDGDLEVIASASGDGFGARAHGAYRFGRPEPRFAEPRRGKPLTLSGRDLGAPVELHPEPEQR